MPDEKLCAACNTPLKTPVRTFCHLCSEKLAWVRANVNAVMRSANMPHPREFQCSDCEAPATAYDHRCYSLPLEVDPVCHACNIRRGHAVDIVECINAVKEYGFVIPTSVPQAIRSPRTKRQKNGIDADVVNMQRQRIQDALIACASNVSMAARMLGINRTTLYSRMESLGIPR